MFIHSYFRKGAAYTGLYGEGTGHIVMENVACSGNEKSLSECKYRGWGVHDCAHTQDAGCFCADSGIHLYFHIKFDLTTILYNLVSCYNVYIHNDTFHGLKVLQFMSSFNALTVAYFIDQVSELVNYC